MTWLRSGSREVLLASVILGLGLLFGLLNSQFFSLVHLFGIGRSMVVIGLLSLGLLLVLITGGIDVSVSATAVASMYITATVLLEVDFHGPFLVGALIACAIGACFGLVNAILVTRLGLPSLIVTLGTLTLFRGGLLAFVGTQRLRELPSQMSEFSTASSSPSPPACGRPTSTSRSWSSSWWHSSWPGACAPPPGVGPCMRSGTTRRQHSDSASP